MSAVETGEVGGCAEPCEVKAEPEGSTTALGGGGLRRSSRIVRPVKRLITEV